MTNHSPPIGGRVSGRTFVAWVTLLLALVALAVIPTSASADEYEHIFCDTYLAPDETCPPNGSAEYAHLQLVKGDANDTSHETCVDAYIDEAGGYYTEQKCMYYAGEEARTFPEGKYGYPRSWNGGSVEHIVLALEAGYHT